MSKLQRGDQLPPRLQEAILRRYVHRMTEENIRERPEMAKHQRANGYRMPIISDAAWLQEHSFHVRNDGELDERHNHCEPGWVAD